MKFISTRTPVAASAPETVFRGLAADGGLYLPRLSECSVSDMKIESLGDAEKFVLDALFDEFPQSVREEAVFRLLSRFPQDEPVPVVKKGPFHYLELFHGKTGAFKDVALSMLPVFMRYSAQGKKVLVLTATSGDTGSAAMQGFAGVEGTEIVVFYPATGTSRIQRLQMTTPAEANVHAVGIKGNFDDAQGAVKKMFSDQVFAAEAARAGVTLSSANSINTGRLIPQIAYYTYAAGKLGGEFDCVVPSGNFGNILAAYYAKRLGAPIKKLVVASNVNDVLARFVKTGVYDPGERFTVTNSPSMDIRRSSNVERLLWELNFEGDEEAACAETSRLMKSLEEKNRYELSDAAKKRLFELFEGGVASVEETEMEMCRVYEKDGYLVDPHTAVASCVARKLGYPKEGRPCLVAATATAYKFPETSMNAFRKNVLLDMPENFRDLETLPVVQKEICEVSAMPDAVRRYFA